MGNLEQWHPQPRIVAADDEARALLTEARRASEAEYASAEARGDPVGTTVWSVQAYRLVHGETSPGSEP